MGVRDSVFRADDCGGGERARACVCVCVCTRAENGSFIHNNMYNTIAVRMLLKSFIITIICFYFDCDI